MAFAIAALGASDAGDDRRLGLRRDLAPVVLQRPRGVAPMTAVTPRMKRFAVVGQPIAHSRSPEIFAALSRAAGDSAHLRADRDRARASSTRAFAAARASTSTAGTSPRRTKTRALAAADDVSADARTVGAANVITFRDGRAARDEHRRRGRHRAACVRAAIDPAGPAGDAARRRRRGALRPSLALAQLGAARIAIANRTLGRAPRADRRSASAPPDATELLRRRRRRRAPLVINATSDGGSRAPPRCGLHARRLVRRPAVQTDRRRRSCERRARPGTTR